ncbi:ribonuclease III domain-containing protein [Methanohalophilus sp.]
MTEKVDKKKISEFIQYFLNDTSDISDKDLEIYNQALTHSSSSGSNNKILALLGDSILNFIIRSSLINDNPDFGNGDITKQCQVLESNENFRNIAIELNIIDYMDIDNGTLNNPTFNSDNEVVNATAFEALFGAVYLCIGWSKTAELVDKYVLGKLN